jgi:hypothetical protein
MIQFLVRHEHAYTMASFLEDWGRGLAGRVRILPYESLIEGVEFKHSNAAFIFADLDRLAAWPPAREVMGKLHDEMLKRYGAARVLNDPNRSLLRYDLLRKLRAEGINDFDVQRVTEAGPPRSYPVFLRPEDEHQFSGAKILETEGEYRAALDTLARQGVPLDGLLAVGYRGAPDGHGVFRKFAAFVVGDTIIPRHVFFSRNWVIKSADLVEPEMIDEELAFMEERTHEPLLRRAAQLAGIRYGRIDYGLVNGCPQVWEINTNPMLANPPAPDGTEVAVSPRSELHRRFAARIAAAFASIDPEG